MGRPAHLVLSSTVVDIVAENEHMTTQKIVQMFEVVKALVSLLDTSRLPIPLFHVSESTFYGWFFLVTVFMVLVISFRTAEIFCHFNATVKVSSFFNVFKKKQQHQGR